MKIKSTVIVLFSICLLCACAFEGYDAEVQTPELIQQETPLYNYLQLVSSDNGAEILEVACIEFIYPFIVLVYDQEEEYVKSESISNNANFANFLRTLEGEHSISLSYPITGTLKDGSPLSITNNEELEASLSNCIDEELEILYGIALQCDWKVTDSSEENSPYIDSVFSMKEANGSVKYTIDETNYFGTWIFYYAGTELHLNIFFEYDEQNRPTNENNLPLVKEDWNQDWRILDYSEERIEIEKDNMVYVLEKSCEDESKEIEEEEIINQ